MRVVDISPAHGFSEVSGWPLCETESRTTFILDLAAPFFWLDLAALFSCLWRTEINILSYT